MRRDHRRKLKFLDANYPIGTTQCLARATTDLHPKGAFLVKMTASLLPSAMLTHFADCVISWLAEHIR